MSRGELVLAKVVSDLGALLERALEERVTGHATVEPQDALLLDAAGCGVLAFERGVPVAARHTETGRTGREALAELSIPGPCRVELHDGAPPPVADDADAAIPPWLPAELLADDPELANRIRTAAADRDAGGRTDGDALASFLQDRERVEAIRREARAEAVARAREWGLEDALAEPLDGAEGTDALADEGSGGEEFGDDFGDGDLADESR